MSAAILRLATFATLCFAISAQYGNQVPTPSNDTTQIPPINASPRLWINGTAFDPLLIFPLSMLSGQQSGPVYDQWGSNWTMTLLDAANGNELGSKNDQIAYISCEPGDYTGNINANDVLNMALSPTNLQARIYILYSTKSDHCNYASASAGAGSYPGLFTTLNSTAASVAVRSLTSAQGSLGATVSFDQQSNGRGFGNSAPGSTSGQPGPTTAVAMIILYTITGLITLMFLVIIVTGAIRAHRHPERYGPRNAGAGRARRSRAKGLARAMLDTIPIVKFGEKEEERAKSVDIEMSSEIPKQDKAVVPEVQPAIDIEDVPGAVTKPDGTDAEGHLGCAICTEDFNKGEEVRVLPCNHKFHPVCVDPWLLNVSGTCPLCRIDLRPAETEAEAEAGRNAGPDIRRRSVLTQDVAPPLGFVSLRLSSRDLNPDRDVAALRSVATTGSRAERIAALRQLRQQRQVEGAQPDEERGLSTRLRQRFRVLTRRQGEDDESGGDRQSRLGPPRATWST